MQCRIVSRLARVHSIVRCKPSRRGVSVLKSNSSRAFPGAPKRLPDRSHSLAGASVMAGLKTLLPQYLVRFGLELRWVAAVGLLMLVGLAVTAAVVVLRLPSAHGELELVAADEDVEITVQQNGKEPKVLGLRKQTKELLDLKKRLGYGDLRNQEGENCDLCANATFGRGYVEPVAPAPSRNGHAAGANDMDELVRLVTDQVMAALNGARR